VGVVRTTRIGGDRASPGAAHERQNGCQAALITCHLVGHNDPSGFLGSRHGQSFRVAHSALNSDLQSNKWIGAGQGLNGLIVIYITVDLGVDDAPHIGCAPALLF